MQPLIIIEGNISAGKSTLTKELAAALGCRVFLEPTSTNPFLADFYRDPKKYALRMQVTSGCHLFFVLLFLFSFVLFFWREKKD